MKTTELITVLKEKIANGYAAPNGRLPNIGNIAKDFSVSPMTAQKAIKVLVEAEVLSSTRGKGVFLKRNPGFERLRMDCAMECGVRESRTIIGEERVTAEEYRSGKVWPETIAQAFYPMDLHDATQGIIKVDLPRGVVPTVPRGALIPAGSSGLIAAGRIIASDRLANAALRIQAVCMATGQAAGALAALSAERHCEPKDLPYAVLREELLAHRVILPENGEMASPAGGREECRA